MAKRRTLTDEEKRRKELIKELLRETPLINGQDLNNIMKEFIAEMVNGSLEGELDDELNLIDKAIVYKDKRIKIDFKFKDEYKKMMSIIET